MVNPTPQDLLDDALTAMSDVPCAALSRSERQTFRRKLYGRVEELNRIDAREMRQAIPREEPAP